jgi:hypothetical protein
VSITPPEAAAALEDIEHIVKRVKQSAIYRYASVLLIAWGVLVMLGYAGSYAWPGSASTIWLTLDAAGLAVMIAFALYARKQRRREINLGFVRALLLFYGFGLLWSAVLGKFGPREMSAFWTTFFMFGYSIGGIWFGRGFTILGLAITGLTVAGYLWVGSAFDLYMAAVNGGGLIVCGLWMRRA